jgi:large subunit ribosomal protein L33
MNVEQFREVTAGEHRPRGSLLTWRPIRLDFADFFRQGRRLTLSFQSRTAAYRNPFTGAAQMRDLIKLTCQDCKRDNYVTDKNKRTQTEKFEIKKFCNACRKHTQHKEGKISKG